MDNFTDDDSDYEDEEFNNLALLLYCPRRLRVFKLRPDHFTYWRDDEFFNRYRLSKNTVHFLVELIGERIGSRTNW